MPTVAVIGRSTEGTTKRAATPIENAAVVWPLGRLFRVAGADSASPRSSRGSTYTLRIRPEMFAAMSSPIATNPLVRRIRIRATTAIVATAAIRAVALTTSRVASTEAAAGDRVSSAPRRAASASWRPGIVWTVNQ